MDGFSPIIRTLEYGRWTDDDGKSYLFSATLRDKSHDYGRGVRSVDVKLLHEITSPQQSDITESTVNKKSKQTEEIGYLTGYVIERPSCDFFDTADAISAELQGISTYFCESNGKATRCKHPKLQEQSPMAVRGGGLFNIELVEIKPGYQGKDFGLRLIHEAFFFLGHDWTLAVLMVGESNFPKWDHGSLPHEGKAWSKLAVYFSRMGFIQSSTTRNGADYFFLTRELYQGEDNNLNEARRRWVGKENVSTQIQIYTPPPFVESAGLDSELKEAIIISIQSNDGLNKVEELIQRGASIDGAFGLHVAIVANRADRASPNLVLARLIELGGDVNLPDQSEFRPVHLAASKFNAKEISLLVKAGANPLATDSEGRTAIDIVRRSCHETGDYIGNSCISTNVREVDVIPPYETIMALMTNDEKAKLVDGWMAPRLFYAMKREAAIEVDDLMELVGGYSPRLAFIPASVLQNYPNGKYFPCLEALSLVCYHIQQLMEGGMTPTVERIVSRVRGIPIYEDFVRKGGKVEYVLDLLLYVLKYEEKEYSDEDSDEGQPGASYFDGMYELARFMLINRGGGTWSGFRGPYEDTRMLLLNQYP